MGFFLAGAWDAGCPGTRRVRAGRSQAWSQGLAGWEDRGGTGGQVCVPPMSGGDCEVGRMGTHAGAREGRPRTLEGSGSFPQEEKRARRKEGLGVWWAEGLGDEAGDCRSPSACRLLATHHGQVCRAGGSWAGQARQGGWHFSPQSAALRPRMGGARWTDMSSCLGPHGFLNGSPRKKPRVSGLERTVLVT